MRLELDMPVELTDGEVCELGDVIVEPHSRTVTHVILRPRHEEHLSRLVPIDDLAGGESEAVTLA